MAEGIDPTDPTTEKTPLIPGTGDDDDDDGMTPGIDWEAPIDPEEPDRTQPFEPGGASTPYPEGESIHYLENRVSHKSVTNP